MAHELDERLLLLDRLDANIRAVGEDVEAREGQSVLVEAGCGPQRAFAEIRVDRSQVVRLDAERLDRFRPELDLRERSGNSRRSRAEVDRQDVITHQRTTRA